MKITGEEMIEIFGKDQASFVPGKIIEIAWEETPPTTEFWVLLKLNKIRKDYYADYMFFAFREGTTESKLVNSLRVYYSDKFTVIEKISVIEP